MIIICWHIKVDAIFEFLHQKKCYFITRMTTIFVNLLSGRFKFNLIVNKYNRETSNWKYKEDFFNTLGVWITLWEKTLIPFLPGCTDYRSRTELSWILFWMLFEYLPWTGSWWYSDQYLPFPTFVSNGCEMTTWC